MLATSLSPSQIEQFLNEGHLILHNCFSREAAQECVDEAWQLLGYDPQNPASWEQPLRFLFPQQKRRLREFAPTLWDAMCQLSGGEERLSWPDSDIGQWVINFWRGRDEAWTPPGPQVKGWHKDGNFFRHFLDSPEQGLLVVPLFSDVATRGGATVFAADSIPVITRFLAERPEGVLPGQFGFQSLVEQCRDFREFTGQVGDVAIFHPFMLHSFSQNHSGKPRFITNICLSLKEPMNFQRADGNYSAVEAAILRALDVDQLDFQITGERERVQP
jgi:hypothetical protein